jgi:hypothetical protein
MLEDVAVCSLSVSSLDRLACFLRHWVWADEAMARFERELADGWEEQDSDPMSDHPFGAYYHWCALLCGLSEAARDGKLLRPAQMDPIRGDLEASLLHLQTCRDLLVAIPASMEEQPRIVDLLHDERLSRLRRLHLAFGEALRDEQALREIASLDH